MKCNTAKEWKKFYKGCAIQTKWVQNTVFRQSGSQAVKQSRMRYKTSVGRSLPPSSSHCLPHFSMEEEEVYEGARDRWGCYFVVTHVSDRYARAVYFYPPIGRTPWQQHQSARFTECIIPLDRLDIHQRERTVTRVPVFERRWRFHDLMARLPDLHECEPTCVDLSEAEFQQRLVAYLDTGNLDFPYSLRYKIGFILLLILFVYYCCTIIVR